jgi:hypothetical protein
MDVIINQIPNTNQPVLPHFMHDEQDNDSEISKESEIGKELLHQELLQLMKLIFNRLKDCLEAEKGIKMHM